MTNPPSAARRWLHRIASEWFLIGMLAAVVLASLFPEFGATGGALHAETTTNLGIALVFFLPGDSLLVTAGLYAANGTLNILTLNLVLIPCAILGDATSYYIGAKSGPKLFNKPRSRFFRISASPSTPRRRTMFMASWRLRNAAVLDLTTRPRARIHSRESRPDCGANTSPIATPTPTPISMPSRYSTP